MLSETVETIAHTTPDGLLNLSVRVGAADTDVAVSVRVTPLRPSGEIDANGWPTGYFDQVAGSMPNLERAAKLLRARAGAGVIHLPDTSTLSHRLPRGED
jgi:hypothetical protein